ncbi:MAG: SpoIVB peptidase [Clostridia bacterium]|nr:SpoIVB peptidase [Clostridia bacterium]
MKNKKFCITITLLTILLIYITNITTIPKKIVLFQNENFNISHVKGIELEGNLKSIEENVLKKISTINSEIVGNIKLKLTALGMIPIKDITVSVIPQTMVIPSGKAVGLKVYSKGVLIIGESEVDGIDGKKYKPYEKANVKKGDLILEFDGEKIETTDELIKAVRKSRGELTNIVVEREGEKIETSIQAVKAIDDNNYKIGLWVRDGTMGIGTTTFYNPNTGDFVALGHGVSDLDTGKMIELEHGTLNKVNLISVLPSKKSNPGEIVGTLDSFNEYGEIIKSDETGIYGKIYDYRKEDFITAAPVPVASRNEIELGKATLLCTLDNEKIEEFEIEIQRKYSNSEAEAKSMIVKILDEDLISKTGGIVQGMSGSPILQNGKLVGALTHVFVNDPVRGFAVYADTMIDNKI